ncbi:hypothetical protein ABKN59_006446 [Abortiporus biennis]
MRAAAVEGRRQGDQRVESSSPAIYQRISMILLGANKLTCFRESGWNNQTYAALQSVLLWNAKKSEAPTTPPR